MPESSKSVDIFAGRRAAPRVPSASEGPGGAVPHICLNTRGRENLLESPSKPDVTLMAESIRFTLNKSAAYAQGTVASRDLGA